MTTSKAIQEALRKLPSVDEVIQKYSSEIHHTPHKLLVKTIRKTLQEIRHLILNGKLESNVEIEIDLMLKASISNISSSSLYPIINGTGIILHTGLGRAPLSYEILKKSIDSIYPYANVEFEVKSGNRGERNLHVSHLLNSLTHSESSIVVNNNAAAVLLMLNAIAEGKEVIISRGQQVEIGGSFRIPDVIEKSGCKMVEVGTTNKTHLKDYERAINENTGAILVAHTSNYKVIGFTKDVELEELVSLSKRKRIPLLVDLGSGAIVNFDDSDIPTEPVVSSYIKSGVHAVSFSGDKLLGGPQAGIICGKKTIIKKMHNNALYRALRCDKLTFSILENTLRTYFTDTEISNDNLSIVLLKRTEDELQKFGMRIISHVKKVIIKKFDIQLVESMVEAGSGSLPTEKIPSYALHFSTNEISASKLSQRFRNASTPIVGFIHQKKFRIDLKAIPTDFIKPCADIINEVLS
jgi:L-seryl-tRNA(Ser) seleniumtransferase